VSEGDAVWCRVMLVAHAGGRFACRVFANSLNVCTLPTSLKLINKYIYGK
jgi:hypothetical protein